MQFASWHSEKASWLQYSLGCAAATWPAGRASISRRRRTQTRCTQKYTSAGVRRKCVLIDRSRTITPYDEGIALQDLCINKMLSFKDENFDGHDYLIILQHQPVFTLGAGSSEEHLLFPSENSPIPLRRVGRGGEVTHHGPGQLVLYPILDLSHHFRDLHQYMRTLEQVAIRSLWEVSGLEAGRRDGMTGVWLGSKKVAAIGVRARKWVTSHGIALNVNMDLSPYGLIVPCGISGLGVTSVTEELLRIHGAEFDFGPEDMLLLEYSCALQAAFADAFNVDITSEPLDAQR